jgi:hypothetical protein
MRRHIAVVLAAAVMSLAGVSIAIAAVESNISIHYNHDTGRFHGKVTSPDPECEHGRTVKLFKKTADGRVLKGKTFSGADGGWRIKRANAHGHFFALTPDELIMDTSCEKARSKIIDVM